MTHGSLFSGIGGFDLAAEWMGWENLFHCEIEPFGQKVLKYYWPEAELFTDIKKSDFSKYANRISVLTGGFPCQPYSMAGKRKGKEDERHLWPFMLRAIKQISPNWIVGENVYGILNWSNGLVFNEVQADLETAGYEVWAYVLPACGVQDAPHRRDRVWFVAHSTNERLKEQREQPFGRGKRQLERGILQSDVADTDTTGCKDRPEQHMGKPTPGRKGEHSISGHSFGPTADTESKRRQSFNKIESEKFPTQAESGLHGRSSNRINEPGTWQNFPTQSPVCGGDDGLSAKLDGITFSKWRNESIRGYGNAICPQVVYQIFKAIQEYEHTQSSI